MPQFTVTTTRCYYATVTYVLEADDEDQARERVKYEDIPEASVTSPDWDGHEEIQDVVPFRIAHLFDPKG